MQAIQEHPRCQVCQVCPLLVPLIILRLIEEQVLHGQIVLESQQCD